MRALKLAESCSLLLLVSAAVGSNSSAEELDYCVIGAGPAGVQVGRPRSDWTAHVDSPWSPESTR